MAQLHKKFTDSQVKEMFQRYLNNEIEGPYIQQILGIETLQESSQGVAVGEVGSDSVQYPKR